jgi:hypothetical protein
MLLMASSMAIAKEPNAKAVYCIQSANGAWSLNQFKPLIKVLGGTVFAEMMFKENMLQELRLRRFFPGSELAFEYTFDGSGRLTALHGIVTVKSVPPPGAIVPPGFVLDDWLGEADLLPGRDGRIPPHRVLYTRDNDRIEKPFDADKYVGRFNDAPVYWTIQNVPCAAMMKEAERMYATQE